MARYRNSLGYRVYIAPSSYNFGNPSDPDNTKYQEAINTSARYRSLFPEVLKTFTYYPGDELYQEYVKETGIGYITTHPFYDAKVKRERELVFNSPFINTNPPNNSNGYSTSTYYTIYGFAVSDDFKKVIIYGAIYGTPSANNAGFTGYYSGLRLINTTTGQARVGLFNRITGEQLAYKTNCGEVNKLNIYIGASNTHRGGSIPFSAHLEYNNDCSKAKLLSCYASGTPYDYFYQYSSSDYELTGMKRDIDKTLSEPHPSGFYSIYSNSDIYHESIVIAGGSPGQIDVSWDSSGIYTPLTGEYVDFVKVGLKALRTVWELDNDGYVQTEIPSDIIRYRPYDAIYTNGVSAYNDLKQVLASTRL